MSGQCSPVIVFEPVRPDNPRLGSSSRLVLQLGDGFRAGLSRARSLMQAGLASLAAAMPASCQHCQAHDDNRRPAVLNDRDSHKIAHENE